MNKKQKKQVKMQFDRLKIYIEALTEAIDNYEDPKTPVNYLIMLEKSALSVEYNEECQYWISATAKPKLRTRKELEDFLSDNLESLQMQTKEKVLIVSELGFMNEKLKHSKGMLQLLKTAEKVNLKK